jgi:cyclopropane fatty-acyl-phospholipid synthase-like methyltransferase
MNHVNLWASADHALGYLAAADEICRRGLGEVVRKYFAGDKQVKVIAHNLDEPLRELGRFDAVVSISAIHHLAHPRKHSLYGEIFQILEPGGIFCNL